MKIYFDDDRNCIFIDGSQEVFPALSLAHMDDGQKITVWLANGQSLIVKKSWQDIRDVDNNGFADIEAVRVYLTGEFSKGDFGQRIGDDESADFVTRFQNGLT